MPPSSPSASPPRLPYTPPPTPLRARIYEALKRKQLERSSEVPEAASDVDGDDAVLKAVHMMHSRPGDIQVPLKESRQVSY